MESNLFDTSIVTDETITSLKLIFLTMRQRHVLPLQAVCKSWQFIIQTHILSRGEGDSLQKCIVDGNIYMARKKILADGISDTNTLNIITSLCIIFNEMALSKYFLYAKPTVRPIGLINTSCRNICEPYAEEKINQLAVRVDSDWIADYYIRLVTHLQVKNKTVLIAAFNKYRSNIANCDYSKIHDLLDMYARHGGASIYAALVTYIFDKLW